MEQNGYFTWFCRITERDFVVENASLMIQWVCCGMQFMMHDLLCMSNTFTLVMLTKIINTNAIIKPQKAIKHCDTVPPVSLPKMSRSTRRTLLQSTHNLFCWSDSVKLSAQLQNANKYHTRKINILISKLKKQASIKCHWAVASSQTNYSTWSLARLIFTLKEQFDGLGITLSYLLKIWLPNYDRLNK